MKRWRGIGQLAKDIGSAGYTITEVMVVLAVSTAMFVTIAFVFQGRQARTEFNQAVRGFEAQMQNTVSEVANGTYQTESCTAGAAGPPILGSSNNTGSCIFLGKVYLPNGTTSEIATLIGRRTTGNPPYDVTTLAQSEPVVSTNNQLYNHNYQLDVRRVISLADNTTEVHAFGFILPLAGGLTIQTDQSAGSRQASLYGLINTATFTDGDGVVDTSNFVPLPNGVVVCLTGQNNQRAELRIGAGDSGNMIFSELDTSATTGVCRNA